MNSDTILFNRTVKHSLSMSGTTLGENIRYFMFKYGILYERMAWSFECALWGNSKAHINKTSIVNMLQWYCYWQIYVMLEIVMYISCQICLIMLCQFEYE